MSETVREPDGILILDKPAGMTSHDCVAIMRRLFHTRKVGHTGTLDPMATGVLPILLGRAAKAAEYLVAEDKHYIAGLRLGLTTDTEDITGAVLTESSAIPDEDAVQETVKTFVGEIDQIPPMYSALKVDGQKLYDLARQGITVERKARRITVSSLGCEKQDARTYTLDVRCSKGTYIRTLCADIGAKLGCGGVMCALRRAGSGNFTLDGAYTIEALEAMTDEERLACLLPTEALFSDLERLELPAFYERLADNGQPIHLKKLYRGKYDESRYTPGQRMTVCGENKGFFALGEVQSGEDGFVVKPIKKFVL
ncbi:MAG: tRNA pseudouridine(55) synthase TruB [Ruminococcaceae bacterium]|nr:tRNA pseudouridine(55) synthase TruB [Oscillospiraceae bacterium]